MALIKKITDVEISERPGLARHILVKLKSSDISQREIARQLQVSQFWVWEHIHKNKKGVPSDAIGKNLVGMYKKHFSDEINL